MDPNPTDHAPNTLMKYGWTTINSCTQILWVSMHRHKSHLRSSKKTYSRFWNTILYTHASHACMPSLQPAHISGIPTQAFTPAAMLTQDPAWGCCGEPRRHGPRAVLRMPQQGRSVHGQDRGAPLHNSAGATTQPTKQATIKPTSSFTNYP